MNVLLVEDDPTDLKLLKVVLNSFGHQVQEITTAEEVAKEIDVRPPDIILLDLKLPGMDGLSLVRQLRQAPGSRDIPIVAVTAAMEKYPRGVALKAGCDAYISKPVDTRKFSDQILHAVAKKSGRG